MKMILLDTAYNNFKKKSPEINPGLFQGSMFICCLGGKLFLKYEFSNSAGNIIQILTN